MELKIGNPFVNPIDSQQAGHFYKKKEVEETAYTPRGHVNKKKNKSIKNNFIPLTNSEKSKKIDESQASIALPVQAYRPDPREFYNHYNGRINSKFKSAQYFYINDVRDRILFSQTTVSDFTKDRNCDYPLDELADNMFIEFKKSVKYQNDGVLDIVANGDGTFTSIDNRRLLIAKKLGQVDRLYGIWVKVHPSNEGLNEVLQRRFLGAKTWGQAAKIRVNKDNVKGYSRYPTIMDEGTEKKSQSIPVNVDDCDLSELHTNDVVILQEKKINGCVNI